MPDNTLCTKCSSKCRILRAVSLSSKDAGFHASSAGSSELSDTPKADDTALLLHTSGTTSKPKAVPLSHENLCSSLLNIAQTYQLTPKDRSLLVMPLFHVHGLMAGMHIQIGLTLAVLDARSATLAAEMHDGLLQPAAL